MKPQLRQKKKMKPQLLSFSLTIDLFQVAVHAIGDRANDLILDVYIVQLLLKME
jgi:hypothetical protein